MQLFYFFSNKEKLIQFNSLKEDILKGINNERIKNVIQVLLNEIKNKENVICCSKKYYDYYAVSKMDWEMEYDIAVEILNKCGEDNSLTYIFELINYLFCYLLNPKELKGAFFLMHGVLLNNDFDSEILSLIRKRKYTIYKGDQELYENYIVYDEDVNSKFQPFLLKIRDLYSWQANCDFKNCINIFQIDNSKR